MLYQLSYSRLIEKEDSILDGDITKYRRVGDIDPAIMTNGRPPAQIPQTVIEMKR